MNTSKLLFKASSILFFIALLFGSVTTPSFSAVRKEPSTFGSKAPEKDIKALNTARTSSRLPGGSTAPTITSIPVVFDLNKETSINGRYFLPVQGTNLSGVTKWVGAVTIGSQTYYVQSTRMQVVNDNLIYIVIPSINFNVGLSFIFAKPVEGKTLYSNRASTTIIGIHIPEVEICNNTIDDDSDGMVDCLDNDCNGQQGPQGQVCEFGTEVSCADILDNDGDNSADCADPDCHQHIGGPQGQMCELALEMSCADLFDNDQDGNADCLDSDCAATSACQSIPNEICDNGIDDDTDGRTDCSDQDCDNQVGGPQGQLCQFGYENICDDLFDNNAAGGTDCFDQDCANSPACVTGGVEVCDNNLDDDADGFADCSDVLDCCGHPYCALAPTCSVQSGNHVATLEIDTPNVQQFPLHGTIPVLPGIFTKNDEMQGNSPFGIKMPNGAVVPAQTVGVARDAVGDYDVVEVIARVDRGSSQPGSRIQYKVVMLDNQQPAWPAANETMRGVISSTNNPAQIPQEVKDLFTQPESLLVRAEDPFGNLYMADITQQRYGNQKFFRYGSEAVQGRTYNTLIPVAGTPMGAPTGALPHLMGVHAYFTAWAQEGPLQLDLRVSNSAAGLAPQGGDNTAFKKMYFKKFELMVPIDREVQFLWNYPGMGPSYHTVYNNKNYSVYPIMAPQNDGKMILFPERAQATYRMAINKAPYNNAGASLLQHEGLGFPVVGQSSTAGVGELWSWYNRITAKYFPSKSGLPTLNHISGGLAGMRSWLKTQYNTDKQRFETGIPGGQYTASHLLGWAFPFGVQYGGMTGGTDIHLVSGHSGAMALSRNHYLHILLTERGYADRNSVFVFKGDGEHLRYEDAVTIAPNSQEVVAVRRFGDFDYNYNCPGSGMPNGKCDVFKYNSAPTYQINYVTSSGLQPEWEAELMGYDDIDDQHHVRATKDGRAAIWQGKDAISQDETEAYGELAHFVMSTKPYGFNPGPIYNASGSIANTGSNQLGVSFGRGKYHPTLDLLAYYNVLRDDNQRAYLKQVWFNKYLDIIESSQIPCSGIISWSINKNSDYNHRSAANNEEGMHSNVLRAMRESVYKGIDPVNTQRLQTVMNAHTNSFLIGIIDPNNQYSWKQSWTAPRTLVVVADVNTPSTIYCSWSEIPALGQGYSNGGPARFEPQFTMSYAKMDLGDPMYDLALKGIVNESGNTLLQELVNQMNNPGEIEGGGNQGVVALWCAQQNICQ